MEQSSYFVLSDYGRVEGKSRVSRIKSCASIMFAYLKKLINFILYKEANVTLLVKSRFWALLDPLPGH